MQSTFYTPNTVRFSTSRCRSDARRADELLFTRFGHSPINSRLFFVYSIVVFGPCGRAVKLIPLSSPQMTVRLAETRALEILLNRAESEQHARTLLREHLDVLDELVNYGTHLD